MIKSKDKMGTRLSNGRKLFGNVIYLIAIQINSVNLIAYGIFVFPYVSYHICDLEFQHFNVFWAVSVPVAFFMVFLNHLTKHVFQLSLL